VSKLDNFIVGYGLARDSLPPEARKEIDKWLTNVARSLNVWAQETASAPRRAHRLKTNWNAHRIKNVGLIGYALGDRALINIAIDSYRRFIEVNINPDGSTFDFNQRDALSYHVYSLRPLLQLAVAASANCVDLFSYETPNSNIQISKGLDFVMPYCEGRKEHLEFVNTQVKGDRSRRKLVLGKPWDAKNGRPLMEIAGAYSNKYLGACGAARNWTAIVAEQAVEVSKRGSCTAK
jgi:hypothetical protein